MEQIERIKAMEQHLDKVSQAVMRLSAALDEYAEAQTALHELEAYYNSDEWKRDFADDEADRDQRLLLQQIKEEGNHSCVDEISKHGTDDGDDKEGLNGIAVFIADGTHVGHCIGGCT